VEFIFRGNLVAGGDLLPDAALNFCQHVLQRHSTA
jgi:hypothetical protein